MIVPPRRETTPPTRRVGPNPNDANPYVLIGRFTTDSRSTPLEDPLTPAPLTLEQLEAPALTLATLRATAAAVATAMVAAA